MTTHPTIHGPGIAGTLRLDNPIGKSIYPARVMPRYTLGIDPSNGSDSTVCSYRKEDGSVSVLDPAFVQQEKEECSNPPSPSLASSASSSSCCSPSSVTPGPTTTTNSPNLRYGCRVVKRGSEQDWSVVASDNRHTLSPRDTQNTWVDRVYPIIEGSGGGNFNSSNDAINALYHIRTPPPPGWKEPEGKHTGKDHPDICTCPECCPYPKPPGTGLRTAGEVAHQAYLWTKNPDGRDRSDVITADRRSTLDHFCEWWYSYGQDRHGNAVGIAVAAYKKEFLS